MPFCLEYKRTVLLQHRVCVCTELIRVLQHVCQRTLCNCTPVCFNLWSSSKTGISLPADLCFLQLLHNCILQQFLILIFCPLITQEAFKCLVFVGFFYFYFFIFLQEQIQLHTWDSSAKESQNGLWNQLLLSFVRAISVLFPPLPTPTKFSGLFAFHYGQRNKLWVWKCLCLVSGIEIKYIKKKRKKEKEREKVNINSHFSLGRKI